jgi:hypothetical protein
MEQQQMQRAPCAPHKTQYAWAGSKRAITKAGYAEILCFSYVHITDHVQFSKGGSLVDIWAPGEWIISTHKDSDRDMRGKTGTSMATPMVAGIMATIVGYEGLNDNAKLVYDRVYANAIKDIVGGLRNGEKNLFAQTGIANSGDHPYNGISVDYNPFIDPYGSGFYKRTGRKSRNRRIVNKRINNPDADGYKTVKVEDEDPNDNKPAEVNQVETFQVDQATGGTEVELMPTITDDNLESSSVLPGSQPTNAAPSISILPETPAKPTAA